MILHGLTSPQNLHEEIITVESGDETQGRSGEAVVCPRTATWCYLSLDLASAEESTYVAHMQHGHSCATYCLSSP